jgi:two-component system NtrC family sensor kinase
LMVVTPDARIQTVNQALLELLGYTEAEVTGRPVGTILAEEGLASRLLHDLANFAPLCNVETNYRSKCGEKIPVSFSSSLLRQRDGKVHGIVCVAQDVTEQKRTEKSLQQSKAELLVKHEELMNLFHQMEKVKGEWEQTMDCVGDMVILADQEGRIKRCNKAVLELAGKSQQEILDKTWKEVLFGFEVDANACYDLGLELFHKATSRWFELKHYPFKEISDSRISGMVITIHDTTEMKKITDALEKAYVDLAFSQTKIVQQEKMASIGLLAAGVAHEINNPLGFIKCNLGMLDQYWVALVNFIQFQSRTIASIGGAEILAKAAEQRQELDVDHIMQDANELIMESLDGAERVRRIVQDLKTFSRMDNAESITANINECLASAVNIVWNELKYKATLKREYGDIPSTRCFPQQLNQVFMNLLVNAAHAIEKHGEIALRTWHADGSIFASVSDTGRGIPEDQQNRVFEPFFTTKVVGEGTGLGLSITYDIIKKHNGEITVKSTVGCGTTFTVRIPVVEGA